MEVEACLDEDAKGQDAWQLQKLPDLYRGDLRSDLLSFDPSIAAEAEAFAIRGELWEDHMAGSTRLLI